VSFLKLFHQDFKRLSIMKTQFSDRHDAGRFLAGKLHHFSNHPQVIVLALPRGGVPVGYEIAKALNVPLDIFIVRKLGVPIYEELAMGAIASGGIRVLNEDVIRRLGVTKRMIDAATSEQLTELERRETEYRRGRETLNLFGKIVILVDDGLATGATMRSGVQALHRHKPARIVVAVPVGPEETCDQFKGEVDEVVCGKNPTDFRSVGAWYEDFTQTKDEEVCALLHRASLVPH
jgi:putative phosphoribosyl transferase